MKAKKLKHKLKMSQHSDSEAFASPSLIDLGSLNDFLAAFSQIQTEIVDSVFRFNEMENKDGFWLLEEEDDEFINGGVLRVMGGRIYAISEDVHRFVENVFSRKM